MKKILFRFFSSGDAGQRNVLSLESLAHTNSGRVDVWGGLRWMRRGDTVRGAVVGDTVAGGLGTAPRLIPRLRPHEEVLSTYEYVDVVFAAGEQDKTRL